MEQHLSSISQQYLRKIGLNKRFSPTLDSLEALLASHIRSIAFGNLYQYLGIPTNINLENIATKMIDQNKGGYCLEHNVLTQYVLSDLGFDTFNLLGRVYYQNMHTDTPPRTHLITIVRLDEELFLFDPGFGGQTPTSVIPLSKIGEKQESPLGIFRIIDVQDSEVPISALISMKYMLQALIKDEWINIYAFNPDHYVAKSDLLLAHWYVSTSPKSIFTQNLIFSIIHQNQRVSLNNNILKIYSKNGVIKQNLFNIKDYKDIFSQFFQIVLSQEEVDLLSKKLGLH